VKINVRKDSQGSSVRAARERAKNINFNYEVIGNQIFLDEHLTTDVSNKARNQEVTVTIYVPEGKILILKESTHGHIGRGIENDKDYYRSSIVGYTWVMGSDGELKCQDCPEEDEENPDENEEGGKIIIDENGVNIDIKDHNDSFEMKIGEGGIKVKTGDKDNN
jgi:hypothetical protein